MKQSWMLPAALAAAVISGPAIAQEESLGEASPVFSCFYECEPGVRADTWGEVTTLVLLNQAALRDIQTKVIFLDAHEQMIAQLNVPLSNEDIDMINVCRTLYASGIPVPRAGVIEVIQRAPPGAPADPDEKGVYGWVKNFVGKFFKVQDDPFSGRIEGLGKTECRLAPPSVATVSQIQQKLDLQNPPEIAPIYVSDTGE